MVFFFFSSFLSSGFIFVLEVLPVIRLVVVLNFCTTNPVFYFAHFVIMIIIGFGVCCVVRNGSTSMLSRFLAWECMTMTLDTKCWMTMTLNLFAIKNEQPTSTSTVTSKWEQFLVYNFSTFEMWKSWSLLYLPLPLPLCSNFFFLVPLAYAGVGNLNCFILWVLMLKSRLFHFFFVFSFVEKAFLVGNSSLFPFWYSKCSTCLNKCNLHLSV